jgi:hypothetical protein
MSDLIWFKLRTTAEISSCRGPFYPSFATLRFLLMSADVAWRIALSRGMSKHRPDAWECDLGTEKLGLGSERRKVCLQSLDSPALAVSRCLRACPDAVLAESAGKRVSCFAMAALQKKSACFDSICALQSDLMLTDRTGYM